MQFENVTALAKANIYFGGKVVSHTIITQQGERKTLGAILGGSFRFDTDAAERMDITGGACRVTLDGSSETKAYAEGEHFNVEAKSGFTIEVDETCDYVCSYL